MVEWAHHSNDIICPLSVLLCSGQQKYKLAVKPKLQFVLYGKNTAESSDPNEYCKSNRAKDNATVVAQCEQMHVTYSPTTS